MRVVIERKLPREFDLTLELDGNMLVGYTNDGNKVNLLVFRRDGTINAWDGENFIPIGRIYGTEKPDTGLPAYIDPE